MAGLTHRDPGEQKHIITGRLAGWATREAEALARPPTPSVPSRASSCRAATPPPSEQRSP